MHARSSLLRPLLPGTWVMVVVVVVVVAACGSDDPIGDHCSSACGLPGDHPCAALQEQCNADCLAKANQASTEGYKGVECGTCIADQFVYSGRRCESPTRACTFGGNAPSCEDRAACGAADEQCFGVLSPQTIAVAACEAVCAEPTYN